jgi:glycosyltransferase involved in cell wall biosynthesis
MKLSIVIPVFNEEAVIETTHRRIVGLAGELAERRVINDFEIMYVDDGSRDNSLNILKRFSAESPKIKVLSFSRNFGHQPALAAGILHSSGDAVVTLDADLQDPPELMERMIEEYRGGKDIVYAVRQERKSDSAFKKWTARVFYRVMQLMGVDIVYDHADYRMISRKVVEAFREIKEVNLFLRGIFPYMGFDHAVVYYDRQERPAGETKYPLRRMIAFAWEGITSFSSVPLRAASFAGLAVSMGSVALIAWAFYVKMTGRAIPGWASIVIPLFLIGGLNMLFLGLIGEYIGKIYSEVKRRPSFIIKEKFNIE